MSVISNLIFTFTGYMFANFRGWPGIICQRRVAGAGASGAFETSDASAKRDGAVKDRSGMPMVAIAMSLLK